MQEKEIHLRDYLRVIYKRRYTVYTFFAVAFMVVIIGTLSATPLYMATTKALIEKNEPYTLLIPNSYYFPQIYDPEFYETQYQIIKSTSVARKVVGLLMLDDTFKAFLENRKKGFSIPGMGGWFKRKSAKPTAGRHGDNASENDAETEALSKMIMNNITVSPVKDSRIINISYASSSPEFSALVANSIVKAYMDEILEMKMSASKYQLRWMGEKGDEEKVKLQKAENALQNYMKANDIVTLENRIAVIPQKLSEFSTNLGRAEAERKAVESLYKKIKELPNTKNAETIPAISSDPTLQALRTQILKAEQNIMELSKKFGDKHPKMISSQGDLNILKEKRQQEIQRVIESIKNQFELAQANETNLLKLISNTKGEALNFSEKFIQYEALKREVETNKQLYDTIVKKMKEKDITEQVQNVNVWVIEKAEAPKRPFKPKKLLNIMLGFLIGLLGGVALAFFIEYIDNTVKTPDEVEKRLGLPVIGIVSLLKEGSKPPEEILFEDAFSPFAENFKAIRTSVLLSSADKPPKAILIASMGAGEGKTVTAVNLSIAIAQSGHSVLLIDSDLRKPRIHKIFNLNNSKGLSAFLAGASDSDIIQRGPIENLSVITSGPIPPNPSELLGSNNMKELINSLKEKFDFVICDSSPLLTVTDSLILSAISDGTLIVTRAGKTTYEMVKRGMKPLKDLKSHILGLVINALDVKKSDYYYYRYYNNYYSEEENPKP
jgi:capsular exopolysaccharide synthesis family protein